MYSRITGTGSFLPPKIMTNYDIEALVDTSHDWIVERSGIHQRHIAEDETVSEMAEKACRLALEMAGKTANDVDLIVFATTTGDLIFPSSACLLQEKLGNTNGATAFDVQAACAGFTYALGVADKFIKSGTHKCALVVGAEAMSRIIDWTDRGTCILFADGAGAVVLEADEELGILSTHMHSDGRYKKLLYVSGGISDEREAYLKGEAYLQMQGNEVFRYAVKTLGRIADETLEANQMQKSDLDWLVPHQANIRIIQATAKKLKMSMEQVVVTVHKHGNTSSASIPLALDEAIRDGRIQRGQTILLEGFGGGFTWGSALIKY